MNCLCRIFSDPLTNFVRTKAFVLTVVSAEPWGIPLATIPAAINSDSPVRSMDFEAAPSRDWVKWHFVQVNVR